MASGQTAAQAHFQFTAVLLATGAVAPRCASSTILVHEVEILACAKVRALTARLNPSYYGRSKHDERYRVDRKDLLLIMGTNETGSPTPISRESRDPKGLAQKIIP